MIERIENALQIGVLVVCAAIAVYRTVKHRGEAWMLLSFFYGSWLLGDIYWLACLVFYDGTPQISAVSDLSWYAAYIFLYLLLYYIYLLLLILHLCLLRIHLLSLLQLLYM